MRKKQSYDSLEEPLFKYLLLVFLGRSKTESYYSNDIDKLKEYANIRNFDNYEIYELKSIKTSIKKVSKK